jgi:ribose transport system permease protein
MKRLFQSDYSMLWILLLLCTVFSIATIKTFSVQGKEAGEQLVAKLAGLESQAGCVVIAVQGSATDDAFIAALESGLQGRRDCVEITRKPQELVATFRRLETEGRTVDAVAATQQAASQLVFDRIRENEWNVGEPVILTPETYTWSAFLKLSNLRNVLQQNAAIAIVAIGMTMVIITGGIDLSVGSLMALSAVTGCYLISRFGGEDASMFIMLGATLAGILVCSLVGAWTGTMVTWLEIPPFIMTLSVMLIARGLAMLTTGGETISNVPVGYSWLGTGSTLANIPNSVMLMVLLYVVAHIVLTYSVWGRHLYAVGGNREAARLSGVPVRRVVMTAYLVSGLLAGLGGVILASEQKAASPSYGNMYELYVIAAVVVGGTSLAGGRGKAFGTLIGALIIGVVRNGMNTWNISGHRQTVVLGGIILLSVLLDQFRNRQVRRS